MMGSVEIEQTPFDKKFRGIVEEYIRESNKSIKIVTGEISAYNYFDLRSASEEAASRGVKIDVYASGPHTDIINRLIHHKINVFIGDRDPQEHFMICDERKVIVSIKEKNRTKPTVMGKRIGVIKDTASEVRKYMEMFEGLKKNARKQRIEGEDPLLAALNHPIC
jgi:sugar-specific transcriptional regulator TrmB